MEPLSIQFELNGCSRLNLQEDGRPEQGREDGKWLRGEHERAGRAAREHIAETRLPWVRGNYI